MTDVLSTHHHLKTALYPLTKENINQIATLAGNPHFFSTCQFTRACTLNKIDLSNKKPESNIFDQITRRQIIDLDLSNCNLIKIKIPKPLPPSLKKLNLNRATNIPTALISMALQSQNIEELYLYRYNLIGIHIPEALPASLRRLDLKIAKNIPPSFILRALQSNTIEILDLFGCDLKILTEANIPEIFPISLKTLNLNFATNIPTALISMALQSQNIEKLYLYQCNLIGIHIPKTLPASLTELDLRRATNIPPELISIASSAGVIIT